MCDALQIQRFIYVFKERETNNTVVCRFVVGDGRGAQSRRAIERAVDSSWIEDLVDAAKVLVFSMFFSKQISIGKRNVQG